jgi:nucleoside-diphosphate-sugar epimerase
VTAKPTIFVTGGSGYVGRNLIRHLVAAGHPVRALARSAASEAKVKALGATPVPGDVLSPEAFRAGLEGCAWLIHAAADTGHGLTSAAQADTNVEGTRRVLQTARAVGVSRALHISTEAVLLDGNPLIDAHEDMPYPANPAGGYSKSKAKAEQAARACTAPGFDVVVIRPRFVWGRDDTTALPQLVAAAKSGKLSWIGGGMYPIATTHIANLCHGAACALERGKGGEVYFITDEGAVPFRTFVTDLLATQNVPPPKASAPRWLVATAARIGDALGIVTGGKIHGPISYQEYATLGVPVTLSTAKAKRELGYAPVITREAGLVELKTGRS